MEVLSSEWRTEAQLNSMTGFVHWSRRQRINDIFTGFSRPLGQIKGVTDIRLWPFGPDCSDETLRLAAQSGNKPRHKGIKLSAKKAFLKGQFNWSVRQFDRDNIDIVMIWNGVKGHRRLLAEAARHTNRKAVFFEEAPLPGRITIDFTGVNFANGLPRNTDFYTYWVKKTGVDDKKWRDLMGHLKARASTREDVQHIKSDTALVNEKFIFCPLQVPGDSQITIFGDWIFSVEQMIDELAQAAKSLPEGWHLRLKEHPSARKAFSDKLSALESDKIKIDNSTDTFAQVAAARAVLNVNSSVGLQAFFYDKPVIALGHAFYAFGELAHKVSSANGLAELLSQPEKLDFDAKARDAFMTFLDQEYFPLETEVSAGNYTLEHAFRREQRLHSWMSEFDQL